MPDHNQMQDLLHMSLLKMCGNKYVHQIDYIAHICKICDRYIYWCCMCIYMPHIKSYQQPCNMEYYTHIWHVTEKYGCRTANITHTVNMLHGHTHMPKHNQFQHLLHMLSPNIRQKQMSLLNWAHMPYLPNVWWAYTTDVCKSTCHTWSHCHKPRVLHIYNNAKEDYENDNDSKSQLQRLVWPIGQISQKNVACTMWYCTHTDGRWWSHGDHLTRQISQ